VEGKGFHALAPFDDFLFSKFLLSTRPFALAAFFFSESGK